ncbi:MAG: DoxX family protein [Candidatus Caenarcaniphilales bacterium]|nr:DoxX family protein [Candidatus Caenarcaniphilales bacterium]
MLSYLPFLKKKQDFGLLVLRLGLGAMFILHGFPKLAAGAKTWSALGGSVGAFGVPPELFLYFGFMAAMAEFAGGVCLILGLYLREACFFLLCTMFVAAQFHFAKGEGLMGASHAIEDGIVFASLMLIGAGRYSLDQRLGREAG